MPLRIYTSNRMENLVGSLATLLREPLASPFTPELIVVQSKGMQRWLAMELAGKLGIWANCNYPFPNTMVWQLFLESLPSIPEASIFTPEVMTWKIMGLLPTFLEQEPFGPLREYLVGDRDGLKLYQLAVRIADTFDQYTLFRPEMVLAWESGEGGGWQEVLWREIAAAGKGEHRGRLKEDYCLKLKQGLIAAKPGERISIFGISYLPKYHLEVLAATARVMDINLFLLSPTREYWSDIVSQRQMLRIASKDREFRFEGNPLLASLGKLGRDFSDMVIDMSDQAASQEDLYGEPAAPDLLGMLQSDILNLSGANEGEVKRVMEPDDRSVQIHSCHSQMREIEALHDNLLSLLETIQGLAPRDIVVMTPDIESYAPYIATVFEGCPDPARKIPYSIADRSLTREGEIAGTFLKLLELPASRLTSPQLLDLLGARPVRRCFDLDEEELETIRGWIETARVCWGLDEQDRGHHGLPSYRENSWRAGLDRLLLGYAMPDEGGRLFNNMLPFDNMEGGETLTLGKFVRFIDEIGVARSRLESGRTLSQWRQEFKDLLLDFVLSDDDSAREMATVSGVIEACGELENTAGFTGIVELSVIRSWLSSRLDQEEKGVGFMTGGVTFCAMLPMRSIPFRVVALIGMNDGAFPRQSRPPGFDLISAKPCRGDRSLRDEDRYLFLESILSARDCLYISYIGQSIRDNSEIPPSVLVSEFLDAIDRGFTAGEGKAMESRLVTMHRLQAFSPDYFNARSKLFSYSLENFAAVRDRSAHPGKTAEFIGSPLSPPPREWQDITLAKLLRFFDNPARYLLENRLGISLKEAALPLREREPFVVDGLDAYGLKQELLDISLKGGDVADFIQVARCRGILPPARHGEELFDAMSREVALFSRTVQDKTAGLPSLPPLDFDLSLGPYRLGGRLDRIWPDRMIRYRCAKMKAKDMVRGWIEHLVLNAAGGDGYPGETLLLMTDGSRCFGPVENAGTILTSLLDLYWEGLTLPLRFFPASSMEYARKLEWDLARARSRWADGYNFPGEGSDPYLKLCFGSGDPFNSDFERVSRILLEPMMKNQAEV